MGKQLTFITPELQTFIEKQHLFFVGTSADEGRVNISPKGTDSLRVINQNKVVWLNLTGSGNETAAHIIKNNRMTLLFCSFDSKPMILRLYGTAKIYHKRDELFQNYIGLFPENVGSRQIIEMSVDLIQTSCGFGVPIMKFEQERTTLKTWAEHKGTEKIEAYWKEKNTTSIDGFDTEIISQ